MDPGCLISRFRPLPGEWCGPSRAALPLGPRRSEPLFRALSIENGAALERGAQPFRIGICCHRRACPGGAMIARGAACSAHPTRSSPHCRKGSGGDHGVRRPRGQALPFATTGSGLAICISATTGSGLAICNLRRPKCKWQGLTPNSPGLAIGCRGQRIGGSQVFATAHQRCDSQCCDASLHRSCYSHRLTLISSATQVASIEHRGSAWRSRRESWLCAPAAP